MSSYNETNIDCQPRSTLKNNAPRLFNVTLRSLFFNVALGTIQYSYNVSHQQLAYSHEQCHQFTPPSTSSTAFLYLPENSLINCCWAIKRQSQVNENAIKPHQDTTPTHIVTRHSSQSSHVFLSVLRTNQLYSLMTMQTWYVVTVRFRLSQLHFFHLVADAVQFMQLPAF